MTRSASTSRAVGERAEDRARAATSRVRSRSAWGSSTASLVAVARSTSASTASTASGPARRPTSALAAGQLLDDECPTRSLGGAERGAERGEAVDRRADVGLLVGQRADHRAGVLDGAVQRRAPPAERLGARPAPWWPGRRR